VILFFGLVAKGLCEGCGYLYNMRGHSQEGKVKRRIMWEKLKKGLGIVLLTIGVGRLLCDTLTKQPFNTVWFSYVRKFSHFCASL